MASRELPIIHGLPTRPSSTVLGEQTPIPAQVASILMAVCSSPAHGPPSSTIHNYLSDKRLQTPTAALNLCLPVGRQGSVPQHSPFHHAEGAGSCDILPVIGHPKCPNHLGTNAWTGQTGGAAQPKGWGASRERRATGFCRIGVSASNPASPRRIVPAWSAHPVVGSFPTLPDAAGLPWP